MKPVEAAVLTPIKVSAAGKRSYKPEHKQCIMEIIGGHTGSFDGTSQKAFFEACVDDVNNAMTQVDGWAEMSAQDLLNLHSNAMTSIAKLLLEKLRFGAKTVLEADQIAAIETVLASVDTQMKDDEEGNLRQCYETAFQIELFLRTLKAKKTAAGKKKKEKERNPGAVAQEDAMEACAMDVAAGRARKMEADDDPRTQQKREKKEAAKKRRQSNDTMDSLSTLGESRLEAARLTAESQKEVAKLQAETTQKMFASLVESARMREEAAERRDEERRKEDAAREERTSKMFFEMMKMVMDKKN
jgi:hypothetical protein